MNCRKCNAELPGRGAFCPACGTKIETPVARIPRSEPVRQEEPGGQVLRGRMGGVEFSGRGPATEERIIHREYSVPVSSYNEDEEERTVRVRCAAPVPAYEEEEERTVRIRTHSAAPVGHSPAMPVHPTAAAPVKATAAVPVKAPVAEPIMPKRFPPVETYPVVDSGMGVAKTGKVKPKYQMNIIPLVLLVIAIALWTLMPFMAVNNATLGDQPTALALLLDDVDYLGDLTEAVAFWIAIVAAAGLLVCLICVLFKSRIVCRVVAALNLAIFAITAVDVLNWAGDMEEFFSFFGVAFWGITAVMLVVLILGGGRRRKIKE